MKSTRVRAFAALLACCALPAILSSACSRAQEARNAGASFNYGPVSKVAMDKVASTGESGGAGMLGDLAPSKPEAPAPQPAQSPLQASRKLIKTGSVGLESRDLDAADEKIRALAAQLGGYVSSSDKEESYLSATLRLPQEKFDAGMAGLKGAGKLLSRSQNVEDVTLQYVDQESRIATRKILRDRYTEYLKRANKVEELLAVEKSLNDVLSELDSMESSFKVLKDQIDYATISVSVSLPPEITPAGQRSFLGGLARVWDGFIGFLYVAAYAIVAIALFGIPSILLLGLLYWLCFGKIGLMRKFFALLSGKKKAG